MAVWYREVNTMICMALTRAHKNWVKADEKMLKIKFAAKKAYIELL